MQIIDWICRMESDWLEIWNVKNIYIVRLNGLFLFNRENRATNLIGAASDLNLVDL